MPKEIPALVLRAEYNLHIEGTTITYKNRETQETVQKQYADENIVRLIVSRSGDIEYVRRLVAKIKIDDIKKERDNRPAKG